MREFRYELKFVLDELQLNQLLLFINFKGFKQHHPARRVNSIYFDTSQFNSVRDNLAGISDRKKPRLRWYNQLDSPPVLEIKTRKGRVGSKLKFKSPLSSAQIESFTAQQISTVINSMNKITSLPLLYPVLKVAYNRSYFVKQDAIRLTVDKNILFSPVSYFKPISANNSFSYKKTVVEIKFPLESKKLVHDLLAQTGLTPTRHSKYLIGLSKLGLASYV